MSGQYSTFDDRHLAPRSPRWWIGYTAAAICLVLGIVVPCGGILGLLQAQQDFGPTFRPPGSVAVPIERPCKMVIWIEHPDEVSPSLPDELPPDGTCTVTDPDGKPVATRTASNSLTSTTMTTDRTGILLFDASAAGTYTVAATGTFDPVHSIVITQDRGDRDAYYGIGALALLIAGLLLAVAGIATLIVTIVRHSKHPG